ncbi:MAG: efflux RND transporter periplasmic adaptor subunit, partial [Planctomycetota bacterium]
MTNSRMNKTNRKLGVTRRAGIGADLIQALIVLVVVVVGALGARYLIMLKKPPRRTDPNKPAPLVEVQRLVKRDMEMVVKGHGTVRPKVRVEIVPEVPGKLVYVHSQFKAGGLIPAKEEILKIDDRDYELAVQQANAAVTDAQVRLDTEKAEAQVARQEWDKLHPGEEPTSPLVVRLPQIRTAEAALESAKATLAVAELKLERTSISLPFAVLIVSERADLGQYVVVG